MYALRWRCDGSKGVSWFLRGIRPDGSFYGEVMFRKATFVSGLLTPVECARLANLVAVIGCQPSPVDRGAPYAVLFERLSATSAGDLRRLFEYRLGDEWQSAGAQAFIELVRLIEPHVSPYYPLIS